MNSSVLRYGTFKRGTAQFYRPHARLSTKEMSHAAFTAQPQSITALWPAVISRSSEGRRLSRPG